MLITQWIPPYLTKRLHLRSNFIIWSWTQRIESLLKVFHEQICVLASLNWYLMSDRVWFMPKIIFLFSIIICFLFLDYWIWKYLVFLKLLLLCKIIKIQNFSLCWNFLFVGDAQSNWISLIECLYAAYPIVSFQSANLCGLKFD